MNLTELRTQVLDNLGDDGATWAPSGTGAGEQYARLDRLINHAQQELGVIAERVDPSYNVKNEELPTSGDSWANVRYYGIADNVNRCALPSDFRRVVALWQNEGGTRSQVYAVRFISPARAPFYNPGVWAEDAPLAFVETFPNSGATAPSNRLYVIQTDPGDYNWRLWYAARLADLSDGTDECQLPPEYHHIVALGAAVKALLQEHGDASNHKALYDQAIQTITAALPRRDGRSPF